MSLQINIKKISFYIWLLNNLFISTAFGEVFKEIILSMKESTSGGGYDSLFAFMFLLMFIVYIFLNYIVYLFMKKRFFMFISFLLSISFISLLVFEINESTFRDAWQRDAISFLIGPVVILIMSVFFRRKLNSHL